MSGLKVNRRVLDAMAELAIDEGRETKLSLGHPGRVYLIVDGDIQAWADDTKAVAS